MQNETLYKKVGIRIQELRARQDLSQQDLAAKCNFEKSNMSRLEAGNVNPTLSTINKVANALDIHIGEIFRF